MSSREQCISILDTLNEEQLANAAAMLQALRQTIDDLEDDIFCQQMYENYLNDTDKGDFVPFEEALAELGVSLDELPG